MYKDKDIYKEEIKHMQLQLTIKVLKSQKISHI